MNVNDIVNRVSKYDSNLAKEISRYLNSRKYGLVYEESKPEFVRLPNKTVVKGDLVNILPPRGTLENDDAKYKDKWKVTSVDKNSNEAKLISLEKDHKEVTANYDDLVSIARFDQPIYTGLKEVDRIERGGDKPFNTVINGENFHALETLMYAYQGKIDCIYIDPPYNTGAKDWKYNNNYVSGDDSYRHSKWLTFMEDRLKLAKKLLKPTDSVLICTIDEKECNRLGILLEQLFPEAQIQMVSAMTNKKGSTRKGTFSRRDEYIYFVFIGSFEIHKTADNMLDTARGADKKKTIWNSLLRRGAQGSSRVENPNLFYPFYVEKQTGKIVKIGGPLALGVSRDTVKCPEGLRLAWPIRSDNSEGRWQVSVGTATAMLKNGTLKTGRYNAKRKSYAINYLKRAQLNDLESGKLKQTGVDSNGAGIFEYDDETFANSEPGTLWVRGRHDASVYGSTLLHKIIPHRNFPFPKSLYAVVDTLLFAVGSKKDAVVLDFFAGSGTTLNALNLLNAMDQGRRQGILVTNNEISDKEEKKLSKQGLRSGDSNWEKLGIAKYITWPRVFNTINGKNESGQSLKGSYDIQETRYEPYKKKGMPGGLYKKTKFATYPSLKELKLADGFKENAIFFDLEYLEPSVIKSDLAFNQIAPLLWLKAGSKGRIIQHTDDYDITNEYAVLFNYKYIGRFTRELKQHPEIKTVFIVTDVNSRYQDLCHELSNKKVYKLYESYLKSFEIQSLN